jgi:hypothetical protein
VRFYRSAGKHGVSRRDALHVIANASTVLALREDPPKLLHIGFDTLGRPCEVITDTPALGGEPAVIHANRLTRAYYEFL